MRLTVGEEANTLQDILDDDRFEDIQLKLTICACDADSGLVAHDLCGHHREGLALSRVNFAGHNAATGLVLGQAKLTETTARSRTEIPNVVGDLHERACNGVEGTMGLDEGIVGSEGLKLVGRSLELDASEVGDLSCNLDVEALLGVQTLQRASIVCLGSKLSTLQFRRRYHPVRASSNGEE